MAQCAGVGKTPGRPNFGKQCARRAVTGSRFCVMHGGKDDTTTPEKVAKRRDRFGVRCSRTKSNGEQCKNYAIPGGTVCVKHGGNAPHTRAKARERLLEMVDPAMVQLHRIIEKPDASDADKLRAISMVLDRTGYGPKSQVEVEVKPWEKVLKGIMKTAPREHVAAEEPRPMLALTVGPSAEPAAVEVEPSEVQGAREEPPVFRW